MSITTPERSGRVGVTRDVSASGLLFHSLSQFAIGERVLVLFAPPHARESSTTGSVVRTDEDPREPRLRYVTAVRFDAPLLDLPLARA